jgi:SMODS and SLOG-associating 2TM effector domain 3
VAIRRGGAPFQIDQNSDEVGLAFTKRLEDVFTDLGSGSLVPPSGIERQITQRMRKLRAKSLEERKEAYRVGRIADQLLWYSQSQMEQRALSALERERHVFSDPRVVVAAGAAWLQTKLHSNLAEAYSVALELAAINDHISVQSRNGLGTVCQRTRGRDLPRVHAVAGPRTMR